MTQPVIAIRPLASGAPAVLAAAFGAIGWHKPAGRYESYLSEQAAGTRAGFLATLDDEFAGYVTLNWEPTYPPYRAKRIPEIQDLNVLPRFHRRGVGTALLDAAEARAAERSERVGIRVGLDPDYGAAQRLYVGRGYIPDGRGIAYRERTVQFGDNVVVDDDLLLAFTKRL